MRRCRDALVYDANSATAASDNVTALVLRVDRRDGRLSGL